MIKVQINETRKWIESTRDDVVFPMIIFTTRFRDRTKVFSSLFSFKGCSTFVSVVSSNSVFITFSSLSFSFCQDVFSIRIRLSRHDSTTQNRILYSSRRDFDSRITLINKTPFCFTLSLCFFFKLIMIPDVTDDDSSSSRLRFVRNTLLSLMALFL